MVLEGFFVRLPKGAHEYAEFGFQTVDTDYSKPITRRMIWPLVNVQTRGFSFCEVETAIGKPASCSYRDGTVSCYLGNGNYVNGQMPQGGSTKAIIMEESPLPCPKVRTGIETRYRDGRWQKLLKTQGWINV